MKNLLSIFGKMDNSEIVSKLGILNKPGDRLEARITDSAAHWAAHFISSL